jgi:hypothetical protein
VLQATSRLFHQWTVEQCALIKPPPNHPMQRTASQRAFARRFAAADRKRWASVHIAVIGLEQPGSIEVVCCYCLKE